ATAIDVVGPGHDVLVMRLDADGNTVWSRAVGAADDEVWVAGLVTTPDGGCLLAATEADARDSLWADQLFSWVARLSADGDVAWAERLTSGNYLHAYGATAGDAGGIILAGEMDNLAPRAGDAFLVHVLDDASIGWARAYDTGFDEDRFWTVASAPNGSLLVGGRTGSLANVAELEWRAWIAHVDH